MWRSLIGLLTAAMALVACSPTPSSAPSNPPAHARLSSFYVVPADMATKVPGTLLKSQRLSATGIDGTTYRVMYVSTDEQGQPAAVTGSGFCATVTSTTRGIPGRQVGPMAPTVCPTRALRPSTPKTSYPQRS